MGQGEMRAAVAANRQPGSVAWHAETSEAALSALQAEPDGLREGDVTRRLSFYGANRLPDPPSRGALARFLAQFNNVLIYVLLGAAALTASLGHAVDAAVILLVVFVNAVIGFIQEGKAEQALAAIKAMVTAHASVIRGGRRQTVSAEELVPGDVVLLEPGDRVPADLRLLRCRGLSIDEAILTGESMPVQKSAEPVRAGAPLGDRTSVAFSGTLVTAGQGSGLVVATGAATEIGKISTLLGTVQTLTTPLVRQMDQFARRLTGIILGVSGTVFGFAVLVHAMAWEDAFLAVVGIAVAAIPEGLPAVLTITLAIGVQRMAARNAVIRRLPAVETLGSVSVICSDKTGTLTRSEMTAKLVVTAEQWFEVTGSGYAPDGAFRVRDQEILPKGHAALAELLRAALLCNDAGVRQHEGHWIVDGDPMEGALVAMATKAGYERRDINREFVRIDEIPFDADHRFMATLHRDPQGGGVLYVKGAPERLLEMSEAERCGEENRTLDRDRWSRRIDKAAHEGMRVLGIGCKRIADLAPGALSFNEARGLTMLGLVGLIDPPREEARAAVRECQSAGIQIKMITGDHATTAGAIARQLGLPRADHVVTGAALDGMSDHEFRDAAKDATVFARTSPEHKLRIVKALQGEGAVIAMTGDGVNDAPSLKQADVGVAMGRKGTEAAKEAAEMVLVDDNFASIVAAVREGRTVYDNLKKVIAWTLPTNAGESLAIVAAVLLGVTLPITPVQILWVNMVTATTLGLTLAFEPPEPEVMRRPPRRASEPLLSGFLVWRIAFVSLFFVAGAFGMFEWALSRGLSVEEARTIVVNTFVVLEIFYLFSVRYLRSASLTWQGVLGTPAVLIGVAAVTLAQLALTYVPWMQMLFQTRAVSLSDGLAVVGVGALLLMILEIEKRSWAGIRGGRAGPSPTAHDVA